MALFKFSVMLKNITARDAKEPILVKLGQNLKKARADKISQEKLANLVGVHRNYLGQVERGEANISIVNLVKIAQALDIKLEFLTKGLVIKS